MFLYDYIVHYKNLQRCAFYYPKVASPPSSFLSSFSINIILNPTTAQTIAIPIAIYSIVLIN